METFQNEIQRARFVKESPNLEPEEWSARFDKLSGDKKRQFGINPQGQLETILCIMHEVCGKKYIPSLGKDLKCDYTLEGIINGKVDCLIFLEAFTNSVRRGREGHTEESGDI